MRAHEALFIEGTTVLHLIRHQLHTSKVLGRDIYVGRIAHTMARVAYQVARRSRRCSSGLCFSVNASASFSAATSASAFAAAAALACDTAYRKGIYITPVSMYTHCITYM